MPSAAAALFRPSTRTQRAAVGGPAGPPPVAPRALRPAGRGGPGPPRTRRRPFGCPGTTINLNQLRAELAELALPLRRRRCRCGSRGGLRHVSFHVSSSLCPTQSADLWQPTLAGAAGAHHGAGGLAASLARAWLLGLALTAFNALTLLLVVLRWYNPPTWAYPLLVQRMMRAAGQPPTLDHSGCRWLRCRPGSARGAGHRRPTLL